MKGGHLKVVFESAPGLEAQRWQQISQGGAPSRRGATPTVGRADDPNGQYEVGEKKHSIESFLGGGFKYFLFSTRTLGKIPVLTNIFQMGRNHQLVFGYHEITTTQVK